MGSIPDWGTKIPQTVWPNNNNKVMGKKIPPGDLSRKSRSIDWTQKRLST